MEILSNLVVRQADLSYQRMFGMRTVECRILGVVGVCGPITLRRLCREIGVDKSHGSRMVTKLVADGLVERQADETDQRSFYLALTPAGRRMYGRIDAEAAAHNRVWIDALPAEHREIFLECLDRLTERSRAMLHDETAFGEARAAAAGGPPAATEPDRAPLLVDPDLARQLHRLLGALLDGEPAAGER
ncbi:hypothetical protein GCM10023144_08290 [Pigmentiphaga soli]|uniref:HTH marR-type domain-containing protein n=1 Tax=Pigmentiphaga soli TaxID=1007095 RepID=A0ABP8GK59_9BURK